MKISVDWLQEFLPDFNPDIPALVDRLTYLGLEVEEVHAQALPDERVVVGRILSVDQHPDADRLRVCMVEAGKEEPLQIVCGASNVRPGMVVPVATKGARLETEDGEGFVIKPSKLRGVKSFGMICAADELGLPGGHDGVMELDASLEAGTSFARTLTADTVLEIAVTPNRPDVLSHLGISRELVDSQAEITFPQEAALDFTAESDLVEIRDEAACPCYAGVVIRGVKVAPSPDWLRRRLESIGLNPKNNIVDITNYVLHALGQPLHAFDLQKLKGGRVIVSSDQAGEFVGVTGQRCTLQNGMPVISDEEGPVALAGVMGGERTAVGPDTTDLLLEAAYFSPSPVRRSAKLSGIASDSSYRFERGTDPNGVLRASRLAVRLIVELAGGRVETACCKGEPVVAPSRQMLRHQRTNDLLGTAIAPAAMSSMLERIGFVPVASDSLSTTFEVPTSRVDVTGEIDLIEEVARLHGYDNIEASSSMSTIYPETRRYPEFFPDFLRAIMVGLNFRELLTNPLMQRQEALPFSDRPVAALNPISEGLEVLRPSLVPALLKVVAHNLRHGNRDLRFFEVAHSFRALPPEEAEGDSPLGRYEEREWLVLALTGARNPRCWNQPADAVDFYDARGAVEMLLEKLNLLDKSSLNIYNDNTVGIDLTVTEEGTTRTLQAGTVQRVEPGILKAFDIEQEVYVAELDVALLERCFSPDVTYQPPSRFPVVQRDLSFILPQHVPVQSLVELVRSGDALIRNVSVFDVFERKGDAGGERSVALSLEIADQSGTLQESRINGILERIGADAESKLGAVIRQV